MYCLRIVVVVVEVVVQWGLEYWWKTDCKNGPLFEPWLEYQTALQAAAHYYQVKFLLFGSPLLRLT